MTDPADWERVKDVFQQALERPPSARTAFAFDACGDDAGVRDEVLSMLAAHAAETHLLNGEARQLLDGPASDDTELPDAIGPFRPTALLGRGGMGVVYRAERDIDGGVQSVALKLVAAGVSDRGLIRRFERERSILARLQHPHIAHFIDGGVTPDGTPWLAMEFVDGINLLRWCDARRQTLRERVALFLQVIEAVGFAHRNLVVHRDLKPSNILVDAHGRVRLLDFGIAKLLDDVADSALTGTIAPMTPEYAAPEQIRGEYVSTATDIHALGVVLFELLCGRLPYVIGAGRHAASVISVQEPQRLRQALSRRSTTSSRRNDDPADIARQRSASLRDLQQSYDRDLERVLATAIAKVPEERYRSAETFADDLHAWLDHRPLRSHAGGWIERSRKFVRRHRIGVTVGAALLAVACTGVVATMWQAHRAQMQAQRADAARSVLSELFQAADPQAMDGRAMTARELVDQGVARLHADTGIDADLRASLLTDLAAVYQSLGEFDQARALLAGIVSTPGVGLDTRTGALLLQARVENSDGRYDDADRVAAMAGEGLRTKPALHPLRIDLALVQAETAYARQDLATVVAAMSELLRQLPADEATAARGDALYLLGEAENDRGNPDAALRHLEAALVDYTRIGARGTTINSTRHEMARVLDAAGRLDEALSMFRSVLAEHERVLGADHPLALSTKGAIAHLLRRQNRFAEASPMFLEVIAAKRRTLGADHDDLAVALMNYGTLRYMRDEFAEALPYFEEAASIWTRTFGADGERTLIAREAVAGAQAELGDIEDALIGIRAVVAARERVGENAALTSALNTYGVVLDRAGALNESCAQFRRAIAVTERLSPENPGQSRWTRALLGRCLRRSGDLASAESELRAARDSFLAAYPPGPRVATINVELARTLRGRADDPNAIQSLYEEALRLRRAQLDPDHPKTAETTAELAAFKRGEALPAGL